MIAIPFTPEEHQSIAAAAQRIAGRIMERDLVAISYTNDLTLESLLRAGVVMSRPAWIARVAAVMRRREPQPWEKEPFVSLTYGWADHMRDAELMQHFVDESYNLRSELRRSDDGLVLHPRGESRGGGMAVLIDSFQEYASRLCRASTWGNDSSLADDAAEQVERHAKLLIDSESGLWRQGRGWLADRTELSPGTWSRGQGWILRGLSDALLTLPPDSAARSIIAKVFTDLATALLPKQDPDGAWHALPHLPLSESGPEASGTGLIATAMIRMHRAKVLDGVQFINAARHAVRYVAGCVDAHGVVHNACYGPGPLEEIGPWQKQTFPPDDHHGPGTVLGALVAAME